MKRIFYSICITFFAGSAMALESFDALQEYKFCLKEHCSSDATSISCTKTCTQEVSITCTAIENTLKSWGLPKEDNGCENFISDLD